MSEAINSFSFIGIIKIIIEYGAYLIVLAQVIIKIIAYFTNKRHIKRVLSIKEKKCYISQSVFQKDAENNRAYDFITLSSAKSYQYLAEHLSKIGVMAEPCFNDVSIDYKDVIHIGGPATNLHVNSIIINKFGKFKYVTNIKNKENFDKLPINQRYICYSQDSESSGFQIGTEFFEISKSLQDYAFFIKLPQNKNRGITHATHIIFAAWDIGTLKATEFFSTQYREISKKFRNKHYFFMLPISRINNSIDISIKDCIDLTNIMFNDN